MGNWLLNLPLVPMAIAIFAGVFLVTGFIDWIVTRLAVEDRARAFKAVSPGMLSPLGIIFGLLVGFTAAQVWSEFDRAKSAVAAEASALRTVNLLASNLSVEQQGKLRLLVSKHIDDAINKEWPAMAQQRETVSALPTHLIEALQSTLAGSAADDGQRSAQREIVQALENALDARRQRIVLSQSSVSGVKWVGILLQALCALIAIAVVHSDNRLASRIALALFSTGIALSVLLIAAYSRPFSGEISVGPELLKIVAASHPAP